MALGLRLRIPDRAILALMICPVHLLWVSGIDIPVVDAALLAGLLSIPRWSHLRVPRSAVAVMALLTWCLISVTVVSMDPRSGGLAWRGLLALLFFARPFAAIFIGWGLWSRGVPAREVVRWLGTVAGVFLTAIAVSVILSPLPHQVWGGIERAGSLFTGEYLTGSLLGFELYARYGANALASTYVLMTGLASAASIQRRTGPRRHVRRLIPAVGVLAGAYLVFTSGSRSAFAGLVLIIVLGVLTAPWFVGHPRLALWSLGAALAIGSIAILLMSQAQGPALELDAFSSGRVSIARTTVDLTVEQPFVGTGFYGSMLMDPHGDQINAHSLLLAAALKGGWVAAALLVLVLGSLFKAPTAFAIYATRARVIDNRHRSLILAGATSVTVLAVIGLALDTVSLTPTAGPAFLILALWGPGRSAVVDDSSLADGLMRSA